MGDKPTTRSVLDSELVSIRDDILRLGSLVNQATIHAIEAFTGQDVDLAQEVINGDDDIDKLQYDLEGHIITTMALQQPMAGDLRRLIADLLITNELERMGDHAEGIARTVPRHAGEPIVALPPALAEMRDRVSDMIQAVMDAYVTGDPEEARAVAKMDDELDTLYQGFFETLVRQMSRDEIPAELGTYALWAGHNLERLGDRVTNICERIVYARTGEIGGLNPKPGEEDPTHT